MRTRRVFAAAALTATIAVAAACDAKPVRTEFAELCVDTAATLRAVELNCREDRRGFAWLYTLNKIPLPGYGQPIGVLERLHAVEGRPTTGTVGCVPPNGGYAVESCD